MAIMDMESIEPMVAAASRLLRPGGRFVLSILHPAFNSGNVRPTVELDLNGDTTDVYSVKVSAYGQPSTGKGVAVPGQPVQQWYFHRPLWLVLKPFFERSFALDGLEEPLLRPEDARPGRPATSTPSCPACWSLECDAPNLEPAETATGEQLVLLIASASVPGGKLPRDLVRLPSGPVAMGGAGPSLTGINSCTLWLSACTFGARRGFIDTT